MRFVSLENALAVALAGLAAHILQTTWRCLSLVHVPIPYWDQWGRVTLDTILHDIFAQHNEHRIAAARLVYALDWYVGGRQELNLAVMFVLQFAHAVLLMALAWKHLPARLGPRVAAFAWILCCLFSLAQWENFTWGFQVQMIMVYVFSTAAFAALASQRRGLASLVLAASFGAIATFSMANGVATTPLLAVLCLALPRPRWQVAAIALVALSVVLFYLHDYHPSAVSPDPLASFKKGGALATYIATYVAAPLAPLVDGDLASVTAMGFAMLAFVLGTLAVAFWQWRRGALSEQHLALLFLVLFLLLTICIVALGRVGTGDGTGPFASRYTTSSLLLLAAVGLLVAIELSRTTRPLAVRLGVGALALTCAVTLARRQHQDTQAAQELAGLKRLAQTALLADARDLPFISFANPDPLLVLHDTPALRSQRRALFSQPWADWLGDTLGRHVKIVDDSECVGRLESVAPVATQEGTAYRVDGWARLRAAKTRSRHVLLVEESTQAVVGYATTGFHRADLHESGQAGVRDGFRGHVGNRLEHGGKVAAYVLSPDDSRACRVSNPITVPAAPRIAAEISRSRPLQSSSPPELTGDFRVGGTPDGSAPEATQVFGSYGGDGTLTWGGRVADDTWAIAVPLWMGRTYDWLTPELVKVVGEDGREWGSVFASPGFEQWSYWRVQRPEGAAPRFAIQIKETESGPDQWVGIGTPRELP